MINSDFNSKEIRNPNIIIIIIIIILLTILNLNKILKIKNSIKNYNLYMLKRM